MRTYKCLQKQHYFLGDYAISPIRDEDKFQIMRWRNAQVDVLRQSRLLTEEDQASYFKNTIAGLFNQEGPPQLLFSFFLNDALIGYGGLVHINWQDKRGEVSFLLNNARVTDNDIYAEDFSAYLSLIKEVAFEGLSFNRIYTETFDIRPFHISVLEQNGFRLEGRLKQHINIGNIYYDSLFHGFLKEYQYVQK